MVFTVSFFVLIGRKMLSKNKQKLIYMASIFFASKTLALENNQNQLTWLIDASAYSPNQSITSFVDDWDEPLKSGDYAFAQGKFQVEVNPVNSSMQYGMGWRYDYLLEFNDATAQTYWRYKNNRLPEENQQYPLYLSVNHNERYGVSLGKNWQIHSNWQITPKVNLWQGHHVIYGNFYGNLSTLSSFAHINDIQNSINTADALLHYYYDKPALKEDKLGWQPKPPKGQGYSFDLQVAGRLPKDIYFSMNTYDLFGKMFWKDSPYTDYILNYDVNARPLYKLSGQLKKENMTQKLPWKIETHFEKQLTKKWQIGINSQFNQFSQLHQLSAKYQTNIHHVPIGLIGLMEPQTNSLGLAVQTPYGGIKWLTDDLNTNQAKRGNINIFWHYQW